MLKDRLDRAFRLGKLADPDLTLAEYSLTNALSIMFAGIQSRKYIWCHLSS